MTIFDHPILKYVAPYARVDPNRENVDVLQPEDQVRALALEVVVNCAACGDVIHPFRVRAKSDRARIANLPEERRLFYSGTCPSDRKPGCSRTTSAQDHKTALVRWFERNHPSSIVRRPSDSGSSDSTGSESR